MITKIYPITDTYQAVVKVSTPAIYIFIERKYKVFFGLIPWTESIGHVVGFELGERGEGSSANQVCAQDVDFSLSHVWLMYRNIHTFDLEVEISKLYNYTMESLDAKLRREKLMEYKINSILNDTPGTLG